MAEAMAVVGMGATIAGGITQANAATAKGAATQQMNNYQAGVADINAKIARQNADFTLNKGEQEAVQYGLASSQRQGQIKAGQGASGIDINTGTAVDVRASQKMVSDLDMLQIRSNAAKTAYDYNVQAVSNENQANLYRMAGANAVTAASYEATASILGTVSSVSSKWTQGSQMGMFSGGGSGGSSGGGLEAAAAAAG